MLLKKNLKSTQIIRDVMIYLVFLILPHISLYAQRRLPYQNPDISPRKRAEYLVKRMSLEEKIYQLRSQLLLLDDFYKKRDYRMGHVRNVGHFMHYNSNRAINASECAQAINEDTRKSIEANRWGIPVLQHGEALHGAQWGNATCFPQSIAMAATFDDSLYFRVGEVVAKELRAVGVRQVYAPVVNISRDPRWGRTEETYGEDVYLTSRMGVAYVKALEQGGIIATPKHFVDNYGDGGHDSYASNNSWRVLRETFLEPFRACIEEGGARSVMAAYNTIDGIPCSSNDVLLNDILRNEWNFKGFVVSDYGGVMGVNSVHHIESSYNEAQALCLVSGLDLELCNGYPDLLSAVKNGTVSENLIDQSLLRILTCKFELGLFDEPFVDANKADIIVRCREHKNLSLLAARKSMTLLKNKNCALPLSDKSVRRVGVFGPAANILSLGDYDGPYGGWKGEETVNPYQALLKRLYGKAEVILHKPGEDISALAKTCDVVIFFAAINEGEGYDRSHLKLPARSVQAAKSTDNAVIVDKRSEIFVEVDQEKMIGELSESGAKTIVVLQNGSPVDIHLWIDKVDALLEAWYPGEQGGTAIAEVLFGDVNPGGRLPISWPRHSGQIPIYYGIKPSGRGYEYNDDDGKPMYPFGYGLSYTSFEYSGLTVSPNVNKDGMAEVKVTLKNTGSVAGDEVIQIYIHDELASVVRPLKELKAFQRVTIEPGESKEVTFVLPYRSFGFWDKELKFKVEPGNFRVLVGSDANTTKLEGRIAVL